LVELTLAQALERAGQLAASGKTSEARAIYTAILKAVPDHKVAKKALAELGPKQPQAVNPSKVDQEALIALFNQGQFTQAVAQAEAMAQSFPKSFFVWNLLAAAQASLGETEKALEGFRKTIELNPNYADGHSNLGAMLVRQGKLAEAAASFKRTLQIKPDYAEAYNNLGNILKGQGKLDEALESYKRALEIKPNYPVAYNNLGNALKDQGKLDEAVASCKRALEIKPDFAEAYINLGNALKEQGKLDEAVASYKQALEIKPDYPVAYNNLGTVLTKQGKLDEAVASYKRALEIKPDYAEAHNNLGTALTEQGKLDEAVASYKRALEIKPDYPVAYNNLGTVLTKQGKLDEAVASYKRALEIKPDYAVAEAQMRHQQQHMCDFTLYTGLKEVAQRLDTSDEAIPPFIQLSWQDNAAAQLHRSQRFAKTNYPTASPAPIAKPPTVRPERLRVGYFSADFHNFPGMYLMARMLEIHNRNAFEIFAYSYGPQKNDEMRRRIRDGVDHFVDIAGQTDQSIQSQAKSDKIDIAIHRNGYTTSSRTEIFVNRLAPIQISYLGYPGSLGAEFIDYIVADPIVVPAEQRQFYSERIIYLPDTYQPTDNTRQIASINTKRAEFGLPEKGVVFCCFNNSFKISPHEFDIWMRLLSKVGGSVLWLLEGNEWAAKNLRLEAENRGINPDRLVFAKRLPQVEHLARHKHIDLFLDTFNYNAHTTASDALWAGLPVVTKAGEQFSARVAASVLDAVGLPELITASEDEYEQLAFELATKPRKLKTLKRKLAKNIASQPLFDTERYTRNFEAGLQKAYNLYFEGKRPEDIWVG